MLVNDARCRWIKPKKISEIFLSLVHEYHFHPLPEQSVSWQAVSLALVFSVMTCNMSGDDVVSECNENEWLCRVSSGDKIWISSTQPGSQLRVHSPPSPLAPPLCGRWPRPGSWLTRNVPPGRTSEKYHRRFDSKWPKYPETITSLFYLVDQS